MSCLDIFNLGVIIGLLINFVLVETMNCPKNLKQLLVGFHGRKFHGPCSAISTMTIAVDWDVEPQTKPNRCTCWKSEADRAFTIQNEFSAWH